MWVPRPSADDLLLFLLFVETAALSEVAASVDFRLRHIPPSAVPAHQVVLFAFEVDYGGPVSDAARLFQGSREGRATVGAKSIAAHAARDHLIIDRHVARALAACEIEFHREIREAAPLLQVPDALVPMVVEDDDCEGKA